MSRSKHLSVRIDTNLKIEAEAILNAMGISPTQALKMFYTRVVQEQGWPCELKTPNKLTQNVLAETDRGKNLTKHDSVREIFEELEREMETESKIVNSQKNSSI